MPREIWGIDIPTVLPHDISRGISDGIRIISNTWWRSQWDHYKAHARLGLVLERISTYFYQESQKEPTEPGVLPPSTPKSIDPSTSAFPVLSYIHDHLMTIKNLDDITIIAGVSKNQLTRQFRDLTGLSPAEYIRNLRIETAERYLIETDHSIAKIAHLVGVSSQAMFNQTWKRYHEQTPTAWRKEHRGRIH